MSTLQQNNPSLPSSNTGGITGNYELYGLYIINQNIAREDIQLEVTDIHGLGITKPIYTIKQGEIYKTNYEGPYGEEYAETVGVALNVNFNADGTGKIAQGSIYPTNIVDTLDCIEQRQYLPLEDDLIYTADLNAAHTFPSFNILGTSPDPNQAPLPFAGEDAGGISLSQSIVFDYFPAFPTEVTIPFPVRIDLNKNGIIEENLGEIFAAGTPLPGKTGGYVKKCHVPTIAPDSLTFPYAGNDAPSDLYLEWHSIDGEISGSGLGDIVGEDEDGDGTDFDRIWSIEVIKGTNYNPNCQSPANGGYNYPFAGNITLLPDTLGLGACIDLYNPINKEVNDVYIVDTTYAQWGNFFTYNAWKGILEDDSGHDYNPNHQNSGGRLIMRFTEICVPDISVRVMMAEFKELGESSCESD